jgi:mannan endo-1,4-beta-mannosidase
MRALGVTVPIMVDAPDCGQSSSELLSISESMNNSDPAHNLMFSAHGYWSVYAPNQAAVQAKLDVAVNTNACFLLGEVANLQAGPPNYACAETDISALYPIILTEACSRNIGWMAWVWDQDCAPARKLSTNGQFSSLTPYGNDIVNNVNYGLKSAGNCAAVLPTVSVEESMHMGDISVYPNPAGDFVRISGLPDSENVLYELVDLYGRKIYQQKHTGSRVEIQLNGISGGFYSLIRNGFPLQKIVISR